MEEVANLLLPILIIAVLLFVTDGLFSVFGIILGWLADVTGMFR